MPASVPDSLLLPVETLNREFDGKLLLALCAAERGLRPLLGGREAMHAHLPSLPRSIYLSKGVRSGNQRLFARLEGFGHVIAGVDEEALVPLADDLLLLELEPDSFQRVRVLFAWGDDNAALWRRSQWYAGAPVVVSGNPRTDMMRSELRAFYAPEVDELRGRFGDFLLFNTNFSMVNHFIANRTRFRFADWVPGDQSDLYRAAVLSHKRAIFERFLAAIPALARAIQPRTLVIRPHPSEDPETWRAAAAGLPNVAVLHEGPVVPWLIAARALIHNNCTSAVEAAAVGTPALAFRPVISDRLEGLANELSQDCRDLDALIERARGLLGGDSAGLSVEQRVLLRHHLAGLDGRLCSERMIDGLFEHADTLTRVPEPTWRSLAGGYASHWRRRLLLRLRDGLRRGWNSLYLSHKLPGIEPRWIEARIARFKHTLGRFEQLNARQVHRDLFAIERA